MSRQTRSPDVNGKVHIDQEPRNSAVRKICDAEGLGWDRRCPDYRRSTVL